MMYGYNYGDYGYGGTLGALGGVANGLAVCLILAIIGGLVLFFAFLPARNENRLQGFPLWLHKALNFRRMFSLGLLKLLYLISTLYITLLGLYVLFAVHFLTGLLYVVFGNLVIRIVYEFLILIFSIHDNLSQINSNTAQMAGRSGQNYQAGQNSQAPPQYSQYVPPQQPQYPQNVPPQQPQYPQPPNNQPPNG